MIQHSLAFTSATTTRILLSNARKNYQMNPPWLPRRGGVLRTEPGSLIVSIACSTVKPRSRARFSICAVSWNSYAVASLTTS